MGNEGIEISGKVIGCVGPPARVGVIWEEMGGQLTGGRQRDKEYGLELLRSLVIFTIVNY